jgi:tetratricopeptide (TPR) repeat protein
MKLSQLKEEIKQVLRERTVIAIQKEYQKTVEEIGKALEFYKKNKLTDKKDAFVKVLKQLGEKKKSLERELDMKVQSMYRDAEYKNLNTRDESVNEGKKAFKINPPIGKAKYSISAHNGVSKHKDGSDFWDILIFKNKVDLERRANYFRGEKYIEESITEENPGLWANIRAKKARGEKSSPKNSQAYKDAVKAGEEINKNESVNEAFQKGKTYGGTKCEGGCFIGKQGLMKIIKISKELPNNTFIFRQDNFSGLQPHFIKNGVIAIAKTINPSYDLEKNKVRNLNIGKDVILSIQLFG